MLRDFFGYSDAEQPLGELMTGSAWPLLPAPPNIVCTVYLESTDLRVCHTEAVARALGMIPTMSVDLVADLPYSYKPFQRSPTTLPARRICGKKSSRFLQSVGIFHRSRGTTQFFLLDPKDLL